MVLHMPWYLQEVERRYCALADEYKRLQQEHKQQNDEVQSLSKVGLDAESCQHIARMCVQEKQNTDVPCPSSTPSSAQLQSSNSQAAQPANAASGTIIRTCL